MTNAERLTNLLLKILPKQAEAIKKGEWGPQGAPYKFETISGGKAQRLTITDSETGDRFGVVGTSRNEVLAKMEQRFKA